MAKKRKRKSPSLTKRAKQKIVKSVKRQTTGRVKRNVRKVQRRVANNVTRSLGLNTSGMSKEARAARAAVREQQAAAERRADPLKMREWQDKQALKAANAADRKAASEQRRTQRNSLVSQVENGGLTIKEARKSAKRLGIRTDGLDKRFEGADNRRKKWVERDRANQQRAAEGKATKPNPAPGARAKSAPKASPQRRTPKAQLAGAQADRQQSKRDMQQRVNRTRERTDDQRLAKPTKAERDARIAAIERDLQNGRGFEDAYDEAQARGATKAQLARLQRIETNRIREEQAAAQKQEFLRLVGQIETRQMTLADALDQTREWEKKPTKAQLTELRRMAAMTNANAQDMARHMQDLADDRAEADRLAELHPHHDDSEDEPDNEYEVIDTAGPAGAPKKIDDTPPAYIQINNIKIG